MIPKKYRLTKKDISVFFASRNRLVKGDILVVRCQKNALHINRWAVVVSSSLKKNAYTRNTARRRIFSLIRGIPSTPNQGFDIIISLKLTQKRSPSSEDLKNDMIRTLNTLHICTQSQ